MRQPAETVPNAMRVVALLAALADVHRKTRDLPPVLILVRVHRAIVAETAHELIVGRSHRGEAVVVLIGDRGSVDLEVVRALHERPLIRRTHAGRGGPELGEKAGASERQRRRRRKRARIDGSEVIVAELPAGGKQALRPHAKVAIEQCTLAVVVEPAQRNCRKQRSDAAQRDRTEGVRCRHITLVELRHASARQPATKLPGEEVTSRHELGRPSRVTDVQPHQHQARDHVLEQCTSRRQRGRAGPAAGLPVQAELVRAVQRARAAETRRDRILQRRRQRAAFHVRAGRTGTVTRGQDPRLHAFHWRQAARAEPGRQGSSSHAYAALPEVVSTDGRRADAQTSEARAACASADLTEGWRTCAATPHVIGRVTRVTHTQEPAAKSHLGWNEGSGDQLERHGAITTRELLLRQGILEHGADVRVAHHWWHSKVCMLRPAGLDLVRGKPGDTPRAGRRRGCIRCLAQMLGAQKRKRMRVRIELRKSVLIQLGLQLESQRPPAMDPVGQTPPTQEFVSFLQGSPGAARVQVTDISLQGGLGAGGN